MKEILVNNKKYMLPGSLTPFQEKLYVHLIDWKWEHVTKEHGFDSNTIPYDAILPENVQRGLPHIYPLVREPLRKLKFKFHKYFYHMASSQAANINLFLPILLNDNVNKVIRLVKKDFNKLATDFLNHGFCLEYWGYENNSKGLLRDHTPRSGTDADIAIAYYNHEDELCLWLIEHKLAEKDFTNCGGYSSRARNLERHDCNKSFIEINENKNLCYYADVRKNRYWEITDAFQSFFKNHQEYSTCPFMGGMNQLWRNQLLGFALEQTGEFKHAFFSVVKHPENPSLSEVIRNYQQLVNFDEKFSVLTSSQIVDIADSINDVEISRWAKWYRELYSV